MPQEVQSRLGLNSRAIYRIRLQGVLGAEWCDRVGEMQIISYQPEADDDTAVTMLIGNVADQAALAGVLNLAYSLGLPLLEVTCLGRPVRNGE